MANLAAAIRDEIQRLSRREVKAQIEPLKRAAADYRREIAQLKRTVKEQSKQLELLQRHRQQPTGERTESRNVGARFSPRSVKAQRTRLGLSAEEYGKLVGVSAQTIYFWEQGKTRPRATQFAALLEVRGMGKREAKKRLAVLQTRQDAAAPGPPSLQRTTSSNRKREGTPVANIS